jgi:hypothetical protein
MNELFYTETENIGSCNTLEIDVYEKTYILKSDVFEGDIDTDLSTFLAPEIFQALVKGLEADGYSKQ